MYMVKYHTTRSKFVFYALFLPPTYIESHFHTCPPNSFFFYSRTKVPLRLHYVWCHEKKQVRSSKSEILFWFDTNAVSNIAINNKMSSWSMNKMALVVTTLIMSLMVKLSSGISCYECDSSNNFSCTEFWDPSLPVTRWENYSLVSKLIRCVVRYSDFRLRNDLY